MAVADTQNLKRIVGYLKRTQGDDAALADIVALAELTAESLQSFSASLDAAICRELRDIASYIEGMKAEIGALRANELKDSDIPAAGEELGAIVRSTEAATNAIMECAETVLAADAGDTAAYKATVDAQMLRIFEACSFHDITGQRVAKVVETLQQIEQRVSRFAEAMQARDLAGFADEQERSRAERKSKFMLNGPAREGEGIGQAQIDQLFA